MKTLQLLIVRKFWIVALSLACVFPMSWAVAESSEPVDARRWLEGLDAALEQTSYRGVFVYTRGSEVNAMRVIHRYRDGKVVEKLSQLDGGDGEIIRHGDQIICVLPNRGRLELGALLPAGPLSGAFSDRLEPMSRWYRPEQLDDGKVAGFEAVVIGVSARDHHRYSYRLWLERGSGLLLKSQVRDQAGQVLERFQFTQLEITDHIKDDELTVQTAGREVRRIAAKQAGQSAHSPARVPGGQQPAGGIPDDQNGAAQSSATASGDVPDWRPTWTPDGFIATSRSADDLRRLTTYSDGIASFSIFVEPVGSMTMPLGASTIGATTAYLHQLTAAGAEHRVTVVGEIPPETAMRVAESVSFESVPDKAADSAAGTPARSADQPPQESGTEPPALGVQSGSSADGQETRTRDSDAAEEVQE